MIEIPVSAFLFQSTCLREARRIRSGGLRIGSRYFNPRAYVRHDSMTTPPRSSAPSDFNPRAYVRHDIHDLRPVAFSKFQSTCLREARQERLQRRRGGLRNFNPRAYVRHDLTSSVSSGISAFQSTCLREARPRCRSSWRRPGNFNPRAYVRHDDLTGHPDELGCISIHVPT